MAEIYADKLLRGISSEKFLLDGCVTDDVFQTDSAREDGYCEISITWFECDEALAIIKNQVNERTNTVQFPAGIVELDRKEIDTKMKAHIIAKRLGYEKRPVPTNQYHGNLLIKDSIEKQIKRLIRCGLATLGSDKIYH